MKALIFLFFILFFITSCNKSKTKCYSHSLEKKSKNSICKTDCYGVIGCDGNFYCNECDANRKGIKVP